MPRYMVQRTFTEGLHIPVDEDGATAMLGVVDRNADGDPRLTLEEGAIRVVDPRTAGAPIELVALDSSSSVLGGDREARILREKAGAYSMICDWVKPVSVNWLGAFLYLPTPSNCACTPSLSSVLRKNITSLCRPVTSSSALGTA